MPKPCHTRHPEYADGCRLCWLARHDHRYMELWGIPRDPAPVPDGSRFKPAPAGRFALACVLRGEPTGETRPCKVCGGIKDVPVYACPVHGTCTAAGAPVPGVAWCRTCPDKVPPSPS